MNNLDDIILQIIKNTTTSNGGNRVKWGQIESFINNYPKLALYA
jgi:hypothetical protein